MRHSIAVHFRAPGHPWLIWLAIVLFACVCVVAVAQAEWKPEYAQASPEVREWYRNAELTPEARLRLPFTKCCDHADVVRTQFRVDKASGGDEWFYVDAAGVWKRIPPDIIHWGKSAPGGQPTLFVYSGRETCFFPGDSGI